MKVRIGDQIDLGMLQGQQIQDTNASDGAGARTLKSRVNRRVEFPSDEKVDQLHRQFTESGAAYATALEMSTNSLTHAFTLQQKTFATVFNTANLERGLLLPSI
jgi:hypothetical protein